MKKNITLKVGALALLTLVGAGGAFALMPEALKGVTAEGLPYWEKNGPSTGQVDFQEPGIVDMLESQEQTIPYALNFFKGIVAPTTDEYVEVHYRLPFEDMTKSLLPGVYTSFDAAEGTKNKVVPGTYFDGQYEEYWQYNTPVISKVYSETLMPTSKYGLGVMATKGNVARTEFVFNTRGLNQVTSIQFKLGAYGIQEQVNRDVTWNVKAEIYDIVDGQQRLTPLGYVDLTDASGSKDWKVTANMVNQEMESHQLRLNQSEVMAKLQPMPLAPPPPGGNKILTLDNKVIRIVCETPNPSVSIDPNQEGTYTQEAVSVFHDFEIDLKYPKTTFSLEDTDGDWKTIKNNKLYTSHESLCEAYEAGAGRETNIDTLYVKVQNWNPVDMDGQSDVQIDDSPLRVDVAYPFVLTGVYKNGNIVGIEGSGVKTVGNAGVDSLVTYYIDRATFAHEVYNGTSQSQDNIYKTLLTYKFAPQHVQKYDPADYIKATVIAAYADTAKLNINGSSLPQFAFEKDTLMFSDYSEFQKVPVTIKNLPNFALNGKYEWVNAQGKGEDDTKSIFINQDESAFWLENYTADTEKENTNRYSDDVFFSGWYVEPQGEIIVPTAEKDIFFTKDIREYLTPEGNLDPRFKLYAGFYYNREDISQSDPESFMVNETFGVAKKLKYEGEIEAQNDNANYTGVQFDATEDSFGNKEWEATDCNKYEIICDRMTIHGDNAWVYFSLPTISHSIADAMTSVHGNKDDFKVNDFINKFVKPDYKGRVDLFFAPYINRREGTNSYGVQEDSRTHTIWIKGFNLRPDSATTTKATIKVFKEAGSKIVWDDRYFWGETGQSTDVDPTRYDNSFYYYTDAQYGSFRDAQGNSVEQGYHATADTLYYVVDLNDEKLVTSLQTKGLPLHVIYSPEVNQYNKGMINNAVQFGVSNLDGKAMNEFWCVGTTDRGVVTNMYGDAAVGSYESFTNAVGDGFQINEYDVDGIYADMFKKKSYEPYYIGQDCYTQDSSEFVVSGLNLIAPVKLDQLQKDANEYGMVLNFLEVPTQGSVAANDPEVTNYGYEKDGMLYPNRYGELLMRVVVRPFAENTTGLIDTTYVESFHNDPAVTIARKLAIKNLKLTPVQTPGRETTRVYTFDTRKTSGTSSVAGEDVDFVGRLNEANHFNTIYDSWFDEMGVVEATSINVDVQAAIMKPQLYFAYKDAEGNLQKFDLADPLEFGKTVVGEGKDSLIYVIGEDLAHYGTGYNPVTGEGANSIPDEITLTTTGNYRIEGETTYTVKVEDLKESSGESSKWQDGYMEIPVHFVADPDADDPCDFNGGITASAMCAKEGSTLINLGATYTVDFMKDVFADFQVTRIGAEADRSGNMARFEWNAVPGATSYNMVLGHYKEDKTSDDIFISEFAFEPNTSKLTLELFNGTGAGIAPGINHHYYVEVIADGKVVLDKTNIVEGENIDLSDITIWYQAVAFNFTPTKTAFAKMTVKLYNGDSLIDIVEFDSNTKGLSRNPELSHIGITTKFNLGDGSWTTLHSSLPEAEFGWEETFEKIIETGKTFTDTSIEATNLKPNQNNYYVARLYAHNDCTPEGILVGEKKFATSVSDAPDGAETFTDWSTELPPVSNENVNANTVRVLGGQGSVTILNAGGKKVIISNVLGQIKSEAVLGSDRETIATQSGIVIVAVEGEAAVKAYVK